MMPQTSRCTKSPGTEESAPLHIGVSLAIDTRVCFSAGPRTQSPGPDQQVTSQHPAEVGEMRDALTGAGDPQKQFEQTVQGDKEPRGHRNRRKNQHDHAPREIETE